MIDITVASERVNAFCREHAIDTPKIRIVDHAVIDEDGRGVFGRCFEGGLILINQGLFEVLYDRLLARPEVTMPTVALSEVAKKASSVLLHELYHWTQFSEARHKVLTTGEIEGEALQFCAVNEALWEDLLTLTVGEET